MRPRFLEKCQPAKIGTMPMVVRVDKRSPVEVGRWVRIQERENADWQLVLVRRVDPDGYFQADR